MFGNEVAELLMRVGGDVRQSTLRAAVRSGRRVQQILETLDSLEVTGFTGPGGSRRLLVPLDEVLERLRSIEHPLSSAIVSRQKYIVHDVPLQRYVTVIDDPEGIYRPGARLPRREVLGSTQFHGWPEGMVVKDPQAGTYHEFDLFYWKEIQWTY